MEGRAQRLLNSGFNTFSERFEEIDRSRFALLKMHGQVGAQLESETGDTQIQGLSLDDFGVVPIDDRILDWFGSRSPGQLLFFPWETRLPKPIVALRARIEAAAGNFLRDATQTKVAGFSFHDANTKVLEPLLSTAIRCRVIDVHDPSTEVLARVRSLVARHRLDTDVIPHERWDP